MPLSRRLANAAFSIVMETLGRAAHRRLLRLATDPAEAQSRALLSILEACSGTDQGVAFNLHRDMDQSDYRRRVPIQSYEDLRPGIERQIATGALAVAPQRPLMYARTSGTTGKPKYIPVTPTAQTQAASAQRAMAFVQHKAARPFAGRILGFGGSVREETLEDGTPAGAASGLIYATMPRFMRVKYILPASLFDLEDYDLKYRLAARLAAQAPDITLMACANPSTLLRMMQALNANLPTIAAEVSEGRCAALENLPASMREDVRERLAPDPPRGLALAALASGGRDVTLADLWPNVRSVTTWLGGGCAHAAAVLREQLPAGAIMVDGGYVASELRGTIVADADSGLALPMLGDVFFEFAPVAEWESGVRDTLLLHEVEVGREYYVIISTISGLLRYDMNDVLRVTGRIAATPTFAFMRKGRGVTSICGEKLAEDQVHAAIGTLPITARFFVVLADAPKAIYRAYIECAEENLNADDAAAALDEQLAQLNIEYAAKRDSGRLHPLALIRLRSGAGEAYHRHCVQKGQREAQAKVLALQTVDEFDFDLTPFVVS
ncbi:MAG: GH3 auxin-responsive promoter family protein [Hyphomonadaceae bacterium]|nr:GH3 auxin-responsive promoter family protein [Hyphomonadaceae bacterium]